MKVSSEALLIMDLVRMQFYLSESYDVYVGWGLCFMGNVVRFSSAVFSSCRF